MQRMTRVVVPPCSKNIAFVGAHTRAPVGSRAAWGYAAASPIVLTLVVIVPEYRSYKYFVVGDRVIIVDPDTYMIVEIIELA
jgi:hypothetical protein